MTEMHETMVGRAKAIAETVLKPAASRAAQAGAFPVPTSDTLRDFIGKAVLGREVF